MANTYKRLATTSTAGIAGVSQYSNTFDATTDWGTASGGYYSITFTEAIHSQGISPQVEVYEESGTDYIQVDVDQLKVASNGDVTIRVTETNDTRFAGKIIIQGDK